MMPMVPLISLVLGYLLLTGWARGVVLPAHIVTGFLISIWLAKLSIVAITKKIIGLGIAGVAAAVLLPVIGFWQVPLASSMSLFILFGHVFAAIICCVLAEILVDKVTQQAPSASRPSEFAAPCPRSLEK